MKRSSTYSNARQYQDFNSTNIPYLITCNKTQRTLEICAVGETQKSSIFCGSSITLKNNTKVAKCSVKKPLQMIKKKNPLSFQLLFALHLTYMHQ